MIQLDLKYELDMPQLCLGLSLEVLICMDGLNFTVIHTVGFKIQDGQLTIVSAYPHMNSTE